ncbi:MAG TPA: molybdate ABC transporter substrate-binding protein [Candidatus Angelobacter sp.]
MQQFSYGNPDFGQVALHGGDDLLRKLTVLSLALILVAGISAQELKIAAASDLTAAMQKIAAAFTRQTGVQVKFSFGSSGNFFAEIRNGAPFDVFLSADRSYPDTLDQSGRADQGTTIYAKGKLVLWTSNGSTVDLSAEELRALTGPKVSKVAIANPEHAPYGRAAVAAMVHFKVYDQVKPKLVLGENVSQAAQFAQSGNADVAIIALSLALSDTMKKTGRYALVALDSYPPLEQAAMVLHSSQYKKDAHRFVDFLLSPAAQKILGEYGFETRGPEAQRR